MKIFRFFGLFAMLSFVGFVFYTSGGVRAKYNDALDKKRLQQLQPQEYYAGTVVLHDGGSYRTLAVFSPGRELPQTLTMISENGSYAMIRTHFNGALLQASFCNLQQLATQPSCMGPKGSSEAWVREVGTLVKKPVFLLSGASQAFNWLQETEKMKQGMVEKWKSSHRRK